MVHFSHLQDMCSHRKFNVYVLFDIVVRFRPFRMIFRLEVVNDPLYLIAIHLACGFEWNRILQTTNI